jgi:UDP-N-acetylglucosamine 4-epimerase
MSYDKVHFEPDTKVLVTGGAGFIGSNVCEALLKKGCFVRCLDDLSTGKFENVSALLSNPKFEFVLGDVKNFETCMKACKDVKFVFHEAAWGSVPRSIAIPLFYEANNVGGTLNMMEAARQNKVKKFVYASSSSVYGDSKVLPKVEGVEGNVLSPYALTKRTDEEYGKLYFKLFGLETIGLRYFNVFGKKQNPFGDYAAVIPLFINKLLHNEQPTINGDGNQSRDFTYIENVIEGNLKAAVDSKDIGGESFNIAFGGREYLFDVYHIIANALGSSIEPKFGPDRPGDIRDSNASIEKAKRLLGYSPSYDFKAGIQESIEWYKTYFQKEDLALKK